MDLSLKTVCLLNQQIDAELETISKRVEILMEFSVPTQIANKFHQSGPILEVVLGNQRKARICLRAKLRVTITSDFDDALA